MHVTLLFPPPFDLSQPFLSVPALTGFLRRSGVEVVQRDLNLECYEQLLSKANLESLQEALQCADASIEYVEPAKAAWVNRALRTLPTVIDKIDCAKQILRDKVEFFDSEQYSSSLRFLHRACEAISAYHFPSRLTLSTFSTRRSEDRASELLGAAEDRSENPFIEALEKLLVPATFLNTDVVGISVVYRDQLIPALTVARILRSFSNVPIVLGGEVAFRFAEAHPNEAKELMRVVDGIVFGDGAAVLPRILEALGARISIERVEGLFTGRGVDSFSVPHAQTMLDDLGCPDFDGLQLDTYYWPAPVLPILSGKGCQWGKCVFCTESYEKVFIERSVEALVDDLESLSRTHGCHHFTFNDSDVPPARLACLAEAIIARQLSISWSCYARLTPLITEGLVARMREAGCIQIFFGLESGSQRLLNQMRKGIKIELVPRLLRSCSAAGISVHLFCFVGFPGETEIEVELTKEFLRENIEHIASFNVGAFSLRAYSELFGKRHEFGLSVAASRGREISATENVPYEVAVGLSMERANLAARMVVAELSGFMRNSGIRHTYHADSGYVIKNQFPAWQSHALLYNAERLKRPDSCLPEPTLNLENSIPVEITPSYEVHFLPNSGRLVKVTRSAQLSVSH